MSDYRVDINITITRADDESIELYDKHLSYTISGTLISIDDLISKVQEIG